MIFALASFAQSLWCLLFYTILFVGPLERDTKLSSLNAPNDSMVYFQFFARHRFALTQHTQQSRRILFIRNSDGILNFNIIILFEQKQLSPAERTMKYLLMMAWGWRAVRVWGGEENSLEFLGKSFLPLPWALMCRHHDPPQISLTCVCRCN